MRVLVCGGRDYKDARLVFETLQALHRKTPITTVIEGGAYGADSYAREWADTSIDQVIVEEYKADWSLGKKAGPIRNQRMLDEGKPDLVLAFPGGRGTADMVARAKKAGVKVIETN